MKKEISLKGKTAIVTGGATGIGFAIASELLDADANVIILGRREEKLKEAANKLGEQDRLFFAARISSRNHL